MTTTDTAAATPHFAVDWEDPADAGLTWERDDMHMPFAVTRLNADYIRVITSGMAFGRTRLGGPYEVLLRFWNGYVYYTARYLVPEADRTAASDRYTARKREQIRTVGRYWRDTALPTMRSIRDWFRAAPVESMELEDVAEAWSRAWSLTERGWRIHFYAIRGPYQATEDLSAFYEGLVEGAPPGEALRLTQGGADELQSVERGLDRLAAIIDADPALRHAFTSPEPPSTLGELEAIPSAAPLIAALGDFLDEHGHLGGSFDDLAFPSWSERPGMVLGDLARRLADPGPTADVRRARVLADADALADRVRALLVDRPTELVRFEGLLADARAVGPLTEVHNYWIDRLVQACLRSFALRVGARLVAAGVVAEPEDVLHLSRSEVGDLLAAPTDRRSVVAERRVAHERQSAVDPPYAVGKPREQSDDVDRFDGARFDAETDGTLRGTGASAGLATGTARIILGPEDFAKVRPGDVIVAPSSNASWVPLFSVAGGLLTNTGGVLCHAAVVAREFALPAVVGLGDATTRIPDGATVELDGTTGRVRIL